MECSTEQGSFSQDIHAFFHTWAPSGQAPNSCDPCTEGATPKEEINVILLSWQQLYTWLSNLRTSHTHGSWQTGSTQFSPSHQRETNSTKSADSPDLGRTVFLSLAGTETWQQRETKECRFSLQDLWHQKHTRLPPKGGQGSSDIHKISFQNRAAPT